MYKNPVNIGDKLNLIYIGGGGLQFCVYVQPLGKYGEMIQVDEHVFSNGLWQPPTSLGFV